MAKPDFAHPPRERTAGIGGGAENIAWNLFQCRACGSSLWLAVGIKRGDVRLSNRKSMMQRRHHRPGRLNLVGRLLSKDNMLHGIIRRALTFNVECLDHLWRRPRRKHR